MGPLFLCTQAPDRLTFDCFNPQTSAVALVFSAHLVERQRCETVIYQQSCRNELFAAEKNGQKDSAWTFASCSSTPSKCSGRRSCMRKRDRHLCPRYTHTHAHDELLMRSDNKITKATISKCNCCLCMCVYIYICIHIQVATLRTPLS